MWKAFARQTEHSGQICVRVLPRGQQAYVNWVFRWCWHALYAMSKITDIYHLSRPTCGEGAIMAGNIACPLGCTCTHIQRHGVPHIRGVL